MTARQKQKRKNIRFNDVNQDITKSILPEGIYSRVLNMEPSDSGMKTARGNEKTFGKPLFAPEHLAFIESPTSAAWMYASSMGIGVYDLSGHFDVTPAAGVTSNYPAKWTNANLNSITVLNNNVDVPVWWDGQTSSIMEPLPNWPANTRAASMRAYKNNLIALDIRDNNGEFSNQVMWSNTAVAGKIPDSWTPLPENSAGAVLLADTQGNCIDGHFLRDAFFIFKDSSTYVMNFIGGNQVFSFRKMLASSGILAHNCVKEYLNKLVVLTDGDLLISDGNRVDSLIDRRMRKWLFNSIDSDNFRNTFLVRLAQENQIWICFPEQGATDCTLALIWDANTDKFGVRELHPTPHIASGLVEKDSVILDWDNDSDPWQSDTSIWNETGFDTTRDALLQADRIDTQLIAVNKGTNNVGNPYLKTVERVGMDFGDDDREKLITEIWPRITGNDGIELAIHVGQSERADSPVTWCAPQKFVIGTDKKLDIFTRGKFLAAKIVDTLEQPEWEVQGLDFTWQLMGRY